MDDNQIEKPTPEQDNINPEFYPHSNLNGQYITDSVKLEIGKERKRQRLKVERVGPKCERLA